MSAEFSDWSRGYGQAMMEAIGTGIDTDVGLWVASWDAVTRTHLYAPSAGAIYSYIMAAMPIDTAATRAIAQKCANVFMQGFGQEAG